MKLETLFDAINAKIPYVLAVISAVIVLTIVYDLIWPLGEIMSLIMLGITCLNLLLILYMVLKMCLTSHP